MIYHTKIMLEKKSTSFRLMSNHKYYLDNKNKNQYLKDIHSLEENYKNSNKESNYESLTFNNMKVALRLKDWLLKQYPPFLYQNILQIKMRISLVLSAKVHSNFKRKLLLYPAFICSTLSVSMYGLNKNRIVQHANWI